MPDSLPTPEESGGDGTPEEAPRKKKQSKPKKKFDPSNPKPGIARRLTPLQWSGFTGLLSGNVLWAWPDLIHAHDVADILLYSATILIAHSACCYFLTKLLNRRWSISLWVLSTIAVGWVVYRNAMVPIGSSEQPNLDATCIIDSVTSNSVWYHFDLVNNASTAAAYHIHHNTESDSSYSSENLASTINEIAPHAFQSTLKELFLNRQATNDFSVQLVLYYSGSSSITTNQFHKQFNFFELHRFLKDGQTLHPVDALEHSPIDDNWAQRISSSLDHTEGSIVFTFAETNVDSSLSRTAVRGSNIFIVVDCTNRMVVVGTWSRNGSQVNGQAASVAIQRTKNGVHTFHLIWTPTNFDLALDLHKTNFVRQFPQ